MQDSQLAKAPMLNVQIRSAVASDRAELISLLDRTFKPTAFASFGDYYPHLFEDRSIGEHTVAVEGGKLLACVGVYRFVARLHGVPLRIAGIGQVATAPEAQGRGLMTQVLTHALAHISDVDMFWLYGDRQRYGRFGFAPGGAVVEATTWERYVPDRNPSPVVRALDLERDCDLVAADLAAQTFVLVQEPAQRLAMLRGKHTKGWTDGKACILTDEKHREIWAMHGSVDAIIRLISHQVAMHCVQTPKETGVVFYADPEDVVALAVVRALAGSVKAKPVASFRVGQLHPLLSAWAATHAPMPGARLRPFVLDGGAAGAVRIEITHDAWRVTSGDSALADARVEGAALAELIFGLVPPSVCLPNMPADSVLHYLLPMRFGIPACYSL